MSGQVQPSNQQVQEPAQNVQTQTQQANQQVQTNQQTTASQFDPSSLSADALAWVDRQRTQASQTARANAKKELMKDPNFLNEVRRGMQEDVQHTVEQGMQEQIASLNRRVATSEVSRILAGANLPQEEMQSYVEMFANEDIDGSIQRATTFVSTFNNSLQRVRDAQQQQAIENMPTPQTSATSVSEQQALQARLDEARKNTNFRSRDVMVASILREAGEKGIILK